MFACSNEQRKSILSRGMRTWLGESQDPPPSRFKNAPPPLSQYKGTLKIKLEVDSFSTDQMANS